MPTDSARRWAGRRLGVVGGGQMAEALVRGALAGGVLPAAAVTVADPVAERRAVFAGLGCAVADDGAAAAGGDTVLLAVKPQQAEPVLRALSPRLGPGTLLVSVMAGVKTARIARLASPGGSGDSRPRVVRVMPNLPLVVGAGASAVARGPGATDEDMARTMALFAAGGRAWPVAEEDLDAVTAVSGSGPAYVFRLAEALAEAGRAAGLSAALADELARETLWGAAALLRDSGEAPGRLRERITSPGGTTAAGLAVLDGGDAPPADTGRDAGATGTLAALVRGAVAAAARRSAELSGE